MEKNENSILQPEAKGLPFFTYRFHEFSGIHERSSRFNLTHPPTFLEITLKQVGKEALLLPNKLLE